MSSFANYLNQELNNISVTENGALGYATTGRNLLDLNFAVSSLRAASPQEIINKFLLAYDNNRELALKWLFYARDVRGGMGERRLFRVIWGYLTQYYPEIVANFVKMVPEYGRWDDIFEIFAENTPISEEIRGKIAEIVEAQLRADVSGMKSEDSISLLAKWMPSVNTSSARTRSIAADLRKILGLNERAYRKMLSALRQYLDVIERKMSAGEWDKIDYRKVPSKANVLYNKAFWKHDSERREQFIQAVERGEEKINSTTNFPHDIVHSYVSGSGMWSRGVKELDRTLEQLWKALPNWVPENNNVLVVADGSGSMTSTISGTNVSCLDVANALAIYFAERSTGQFSNKYITFSERPQLVDFSHCSTLRDKLIEAQRHDEVANTNIAATFKLILDTAIRRKLPQSELPSQILIISDMEFDQGASMNVRLFDQIRQDYARHGYQLPRLAFWNICSRTGTIPVTENEYGFALVSGFSPAILKMVFSQKLDAYEALVDVLMAPRYAPITLNESQTLPF
jgi:hypothetical protein